MIVNSVEDGWEVIFQPAHGLLAGTLAEHLAEKYRTEYWFETRTTIARHDDQKLSFESGAKQYVNDVGAPKDFKQVSMTDQQRYEEVKERLEDGRRKHRWIGLLESSHAEFLYSGKEVAKDLEKLLSDERDRRRSLLRKMKLKKHDLASAYEIVRWCDRCSLILCQNQIPAMDRHLEITTLDNGTRFDISRIEDESVTVEPWPFAEESFEVAVEVRTLQQLAFSDDQELGDALAECEPEGREWRFQRQS